MSVNLSGCLPPPFPPLNNGQSDLSKEIIGFGLFGIEAGFWNPEVSALQALVSEGEKILEQKILAHRISLLPQNSAPSLPSPISYSAPQQVNSLEIKEALDAFSLDFSLSYRLLFLFKDSLPPLQMISTLGQNIADHCRMSDISSRMQHHLDLILADYTKSCGDLISTDQLLDLLEYYIVRKVDPALQKGFILTLQSILIEQELPRIDRTSLKSHGTQ